MSVCPMLYNSTKRHRQEKSHVLALCSVRQTFGACRTPAPARFPSDYVSGRLPRGATGLEIQSQHISSGFITNCCCSTRMLMISIITFAPGSSSRRVGAPTRETFHPGTTSFHGFPLLKGTEGEREEQLRGKETAESRRTKRSDNNS